MIMLGHAFAVAARAGRIQDVENLAYVLIANFRLAVDLGEGRAAIGAMQGLNDRQADLTPVQIGRERLAGELRVAPDAKHVVLNPLPAGSTGPFVVGTVASAAVGLVAIDVLLGYVRRHNYSPFVLYRLAVAVFIAIVIASGWHDATF